jgi:hypothetical protein
LSNGLFRSGCHLSTHPTTTLMRGYNLLIGGGRRCRHPCLWRRLDSFLKVGPCTILRNYFWTNSIVTFFATITLFITGHGDDVTCFHCNIGLRDWQTDDVPFQEHARWSPHCVFVNYVKGSAFIHESRRIARQYGASDIYSITLNE